MSERDRKTEIVFVNGKEREKERERDVIFSPLR